jgi:hypothetical protein
MKNETISPLLTEEEMTVFCKCPFSSGLHKRLNWQSAKENGLTPAHIGQCEDGLGCLFMCGYSFKSEEQI